MDYCKNARIHSRITDGADTNTFELTAEVRVQGNDNEYTVEYDECLSPDFTTHTVVTVKDGASVSVVRQGDISHVITAEPGQRHVCHYNTPFGELVFGIFGRRVKSTIDENGGRLEMEYDLSYPDGCLSSHLMTIEII